MRRPGSRQQAAPTARTRRIRAAVERDDAGMPQNEPPDRRVSDETDEIALPSRRRFPLRRVLLISFLLLLVVAILGSVLIWQRVASFNDSVSTASSTSFDLLGPMNGNERVNVAFFGYGGPEHKGGSYLADSIQILSIDPATETTTLIPIPRDFWVEGLPEIPDNGKINEAFAIGQLNGGIDNAGAFASEVLSQVTGLQIEHWLAMDFSGFEGMIDALGGVTVRNPRAFAYTWSEGNWRKERWTGGKFKKGLLELDGKQALDYARARYTSVAAESSDFARSVRQERVLTALKGKLGGGGIGSIGPGLQLMDALKGRMRTNLSALDLFILSSHMEVDRRLEMKEGEQLIATTNTIGQYILIPAGQSSSTDYGPIKSWIQSELDQPIPSPSPAPSG